MQFRDIIGNDELKEKLVKMAQNGRVSHAFMFIEKDGRGALPLVLAFIQYLSCRQKEENATDSCGQCPVCIRMGKIIHPDVHFAFPVNASSSSGQKPVSGHFLREWTELIEENPYFTESELYRKIKMEDKVGAISVNESKEILSALSLKSYEGFNKYMIIWLPERMSAEAANRLLKIIEEPTPDTYFFFITHNPEKVIKTIRSRTVPVAVHPVDTALLANMLKEKKNMPLEKAEIYARMSGGSPGIALKLIAEAQDGNIYYPIITNLLKDKLSGDLYSMLSSAESFTTLGREKQKECLATMLDLIRKIFLFSKGLEKISNAGPDEIGEIQQFAKALKPTFYENAAKAVEDAIHSIESNVNAKIVYSNLVNYIFVY